jgi:hypothetical protein
MGTACGSLTMSLMFNWNFQDDGVQANNAFVLVIPSRHRLPPSLDRFLPFL